MLLILVDNQTSICNGVIPCMLQGLIELVQSLQDAMAVEQQTFDTLTAQLEAACDSLLQQRLSAALCTSQTRLARLCARNMRCFTQVSLHYNCDRLFSIC